MTSPSCPLIHAKKIKLQVHKIINLQSIANNLSDKFTDYKGVMYKMELHVPFKMLAHWKTMMISYWGIMRRE
jgi:hypothetical protein